jgi:hypothetical protein
VTRTVTRDTIHFPKFNHPDAFPEGCRGTRQGQRVASDGSTSTLRYSWRFSVLLISGREYSRRSLQVQFLHGSSTGGRTSQNVSQCSARRRETAPKVYLTRSRDTWNRRWWYVRTSRWFLRLTYDTKEATDKFFDDINLRQCIDDLHAAVVDAKLRKQKGEVRPDIWKEDLHPRVATRARTVPLLERERERLLAELQEVFFVDISHPQLLTPRLSSRTKT